MPHLKMKPQTSARVVRSTSGLAIWLVSGLVIAGVYTWFNLSGAGPFGLGWSLSPGFVVLFFIISLGAMEVLRKVRLVRLIQVLLCLVAAISLELIPIPRPTDSFVGIALALLGASALFNGAPKISVPEVSLLMVSSYIQSVWLFNMILGGQMMFFFKVGWTM